VPLETKERQLVCQMFYCKEINVSLSNKEMFDERAGDVRCQAASTCHSVDGWSSSVVRGTFCETTKSVPGECGQSRNYAVNWRNIASLTMSAVSSSFRAHYSMHSEKSAISLSMKIAMSGAGLQITGFN
jgi:hypothetical protein